MSDSDQRPPGGCLTTLMIPVGVVLLLPAPCALTLIEGTPEVTLRDPRFLLVVVCFVISGAGLALIWAGFRRPLR
jgi:hypothetical protein